MDPCPRMGFWTTLKHIGGRSSFRLDPKYRWLWDYQEGVAYGNPDFSRPLRDILEVVPLPKVPKGELEIVSKLLDLDCVESRQGAIRDCVPTVDSVGSQKVRFEGCELAIAKLEPYLGKILLNPPTDAVGSTEWIGLRRKTALPLLFVAYLLMLPELCETYRRLQSGKRHARFNPTEFLDIRVELPRAVEDIEEVTKRLKVGRGRIATLRSEALAERSVMDSLFNTARRDSESGGDEHSSS